MANETKVANMINPEVMADMISASLPNKIKFAPLARMDFTLEGQPGDTLTVPRWLYIGDAEDMTEGVPLSVTPMDSAQVTVTVGQAGKAVELMDKAVLSGYGDPIGEAQSQIVLAIQNKIDNDSVAALGTATLQHDASAGVISYDSVVDGVDVFGEEDDETKVLFIHSSQKSQLRKDPQFIENVPNVFMSGVIGEIAGCQVVTSNKVPKVSNGAGGFNYKNYVVKPGALAIYLKRDVFLEDDRDILKKSTVLAADSHFVVALENESKAVEVLTSAQ
ncbi:N4-gp56 family major capsid protein [Alkalihalobacillus macyae]|uniref:N4-gp56 family major capsid protein n=1 Tax=Guptibacillus hwajinpoensis TaxID=208199 RepID=UPI00273AF2C4|nr:N4-gp56 family major capsid protein [Alkalihalobacillus macyae]MDP4549841.1 N4-gp56 family major capsid protein [Alkalihalobacillus macyae]